MEETIQIDGVKGKLENFKLCADYKEINIFLKEFNSKSVEYENKNHIILI